MEKKRKVSAKETRPVENSAPTETETPSLPPSREKAEIARSMRDTFIGKELLQASIVQRELMVSIRELNSNLKLLDNTLNLIMEHEFVDLHKSKWRIIGYQIILGILFAMGTIAGFALMSWMTYTFFKDSEALKKIVDSQLKMRQFDIGEIREKAKFDSMHLPFSTPGGTTIGSIPTPAVVNAEKTSEASSGTGKISQ